MSVRITAAERLLIDTVRAVHRSHRLERRDRLSYGKLPEGNSYKEQIIQYGFR
jgi:hypothetical protein